MDKINTLFQLNLKAFSFASMMKRIFELPQYVNLKSELARNEQLIYKKTSKRCYIIGNGPSLREIDLPSLEGDTFVVNYFYKYGQGKDFQPTFYMFMDNVFSTNQHFHAVKNAMRIYGKETTYILSNKISKKFNYDKNIFSVYNSGNLFNAKSNINLAKHSPAGFNVVADAIITALYMDYEEIVLLGADFSSFASQKSVHVYEKNDEKKTIPLWKELFCYSLVAYVHIQLQEYAASNNIKIKNETTGSLIDAYERRDF